mgnify:CR=1 FL=1
MLISHSHHFITVDVPKTGTRSIRTSLNSIGILDVVGEPNATKGNPFEQHASASSVRQAFTLGQMWDCEKCPPRKAQRKTTTTSNKTHRKRKSF